MLLMQNAETINRLVNQGEFILKTYHAEHEKDPAGDETESVSYTHLDVYKRQGTGH